MKELHVRSLLRVKSDPGIIFRNSLYSSKYDIDTFTVRSVEVYVV